MSLPRATDLGSFRLERPLARGGMGEVWRATHVPSGQAVAIKIVALETDPRALQAFREEVRAVAGLDHPHVVWVLDHGELGASAASAFGLRAGLPWLAMELVEGGSIHPHRAKLPWPAVRRVLLELLDALGHAHARGVIHRDLKLSNVLLDGEGRVKLTDFGIAHRHDRDGAYLAASGTPQFMPPEQCEGNWRAFGPWTDLYALGCLAWTLVTGAPPFVRPTHEQTALAQRHATPPPLESVVPIPPGFEAWMRILLEKEPADRYRRAADAATALAALDGVPTSAPGAGTVLADGESDTTVPALAPLSGAVRPARRHTAPPRAPVPADWRRAGRIVPRPPSLFGAGLGLFGLRALPVVGREAECTRLWGALREVESSGGPRAVVLRGPSGVGKSRLAEWVCERAHEVGAGIVLKAVFDSDRGPGSGLVPMVHRALRCDGSAESVAGTHIDALLPGADADLWVAVRGLRDLAPAARQRTITRVLSTLSYERALVVWLDDVHWDADALRWATEALNAPWPLLLLATVRDEALAELPGEAQRLDALVGHPLAEALAPPPLGKKASGDLVRALLPLDERLALRLDARVRGNPMFAVQLVGDWVARGMLRVGAGGFELAPDADDHLPAGLANVWTERVDRLLSTRPPGDRVALRVAALLGQEVHLGEWRTACTALGVAADLALVEVLQATRLGTVDPSLAGWAFVHGMLRESIVGEIGRGPDAARLRRVCAEALLLLDPRRNAGRAAEHLHAAGDTDRALALWIAHALQLYNRQAWAELLSLAERIDRVAEAQGLPLAHPVRIEALIRLAAARRRTGSPDRAWLELLEAEARAFEAGERRLLSIALHMHGSAHSDRSEQQAAIPVLRRAVATAEPFAREWAATSLSLAHSLSAVGQIDEAEALARGAMDRARTIESASALLARGHELLSTVALGRSDWGAAAAHARRAGDAWREGGLDARIPGTLLRRADAARGLGQLEVARELLEAGLAADAQVGGTGEGQILRATLAMVLLALGQSVAASEVAAALYGASSERENLTVLVVAAWVLAACAPDAPEWGAWVDHGLAAVSKAQLVDRDLVALARGAASMAPVGESTRRDGLLRLARDMEAALPTG